MRGAFLTIFISVALATLHGRPVKSYALPSEAVSRGDVPTVEIVVTGITGEPLENVKAYLRLAQELHNPRFNVEWLKFLHRGAGDDIKKALEPFGYFSPHIEARLERVGENKWKATYRIDPGPRVTIKEVDVRLLGEGRDDPGLLEEVARFPLKPGDPLDQGAYERGKRAIMKQARSRGYVDVRAKTKQILVDIEDESAVIRLHIDTGPRYYLGEIKVEQDFLDPGFIRRFFNVVRMGEPFTDDVLLRLQQALSDTGYFDLVDVRPMYHEATVDHRIPVEIHLAPAPRHTLSFGIGFDTEVGPHGSFRWHDARLNRHGHIGDVWSKFAPVQKNLNVAYWIPASNPRTDRYGLVTRLQRERIADTDRNTVDMEVGYHFVWKQWSTRWFVEVKYERFRTGGASWTSSQVLTYGGEVERSEVGKGPFPQKGWYLYSELRGSPGMVSGSSYVRHHMMARLLVPVGDRGRLLMRGELGLAYTANFSRYPNSLRFFAGGADSIRGYGWKQVGPEDRQGNVKGGRNLVVAGLEFDYRAYEKWIGALFVDAGNAFDGEPERLYVGVGTGARWMSPVGTVKVDLGWPVNQDDRGLKFSDVRFYFGFEIAF